MPGKPIALLIIALLLAVLPFPIAVRAQNANEEFFAAARKGDVAAVKAFLDKGGEVNTKNHYGATALSYACDKGHTEIIKLLLDRGADINVKDTFYEETPLGWALYRGNTEVVKLLLARGAQGKDRALVEGADSGNLEIVKAALALGDLKPETMTSALSRATKNKHAEVAELLKQAGAKPPPPANFQVDAETLKSYTGTYRSERGGEMVFALKDGKLSGGSPGQTPFTLAATSKNTFVIVEFDSITITFNLEGDKVTSFTLKQTEGSFEFKKVEQK